jgi:hypothetical protein
MIIIIRAVTGVSRKSAALLVEVWTAELSKI